MTTTLDPWALHTGGISPQRGLDPVALHGAPIVALVVVEVGDGITLAVFVTGAAASMVERLDLGTIVDPTTHADEVSPLNSPQTPLSAFEVIQLARPGRLP